MCDILTLYWIGRDSGYCFGFRGHSHSEDRSLTEQDGLIESEYLTHFSLVAKAYHMHILAAMRPQTQAACMYSIITSI